MHQVATAQSAVLDSFATGMGGAGAPLAAAKRCGCEDGEAATSPLAYLIDLVNYIAVKGHILQTAPGNLPLDTELGLTAISDLLQLPLAELAASCGTVTDSVREVRLTVETLRRHLRRAIPADSDLVCSPFQLPLEHIVAGDVDGDGHAELVVAFRASLSSWLELPPNVLTGFWVMDFDPWDRRVVAHGADGHADRGRLRPRPRPDRSAQRSARTSMETASTRSS